MRMLILPTTPLTILTARMLSWSCMSILLEIVGGSSGGYD